MKRQPVTKATKPAPVPVKARCCGRFFISKYELKTHICSASAE